jgi:hypothetical protein
MAKIDPEQERRRLAAFYDGQLDGELEKVAGEAYELSDLAREVLRGELQKRGLDVELTEHTPIRMKKTPEPGDPPEEDATKEELPLSQGIVDEREIVTIRKFRDLPEALLAKGSLESAGIECVLADDNMVRMDWFYSNAIGGIKLLVKAQDAAEAEQVLSQPIPEHFDVPDMGLFEQPKCPKCGSLDINYRELDPATYFSLGVTYLGVGVPIPIHRRAWRCHSCKVEWEDDGVPGPAESPA